jgi:hypothetical protein
LCRAFPLVIGLTFAGRLTALESLSAVEQQPAAIFRPLAWKLSSKLRNINRGTMIAPP